MNMDRRTFVAALGAVTAPLLLGGCDAAKKGRDKNEPGDAPAGGGSGSADSSMARAKKGPVSFGADILGLSIAWANGEVEVSSDDVTEVTVEEELLGGDASSVPAMSCRMEGDSLVVRYGPNSQGVQWRTSGNAESKRLRVVLPKATAAGLKEFELDGADGTYSVTGVTAASFDADAAAGAWNFNQCSASETSIETAMANLTWDGGSVSQLEVDCGSGSFAFAGEVARSMSLEVASGVIEVQSSSVPQSLESEVASGSVTLTLPKGASFCASVESASGAFTTGFDVERQQQGMREVYSAGTGGCAMEVKLASGSMAVNPS